MNLFRVEQISERSMSLSNNGSHMLANLIMNNRTLLGTEGKRKKRYFQFRFGTRPLG